MAETQQHLAERSAPSYFRHALTGLVLTVTVVAGLTWPIFRDVNCFPDYVAHLEYAANLRVGADTGGYTHLLWHALVLLLETLFGLRPSAGAQLIAVAAQSGLAGLVYLVLRRSLADGVSPRVASAAAAVVAVTTAFAQPLPLLAPLDDRYYLGYVALNVYHNPTITLLKPLALLHFLLTVAVFRRTAAPMMIGLAALTGVLTLLAKPSYMIALLPALALLTAGAWLLRRNVAWRLLLVAIVLPVVIVLAGQYMVTFASAEPRRVIIAPLAFMSSYSDFLPAKFALSVAFPLAVLLAYRADALRDTTFALGGLLFVFGAAYTYLLGESKPWLYYGNFSWSGQIALLLLMVAGLRLVAQRCCRADRRERRVAAALMTVFALYAIGGAIFYVVQLRSCGFIW